MNYLSIPHYRGLKEKYSESLHGDGLYFTTDTHEIIANNASHGDNIASWDLHDGVLTLTMKSGAQQIVNFTEASETEKGLLSAADKSKLNAIEAGAQVNTVTGVKGNSESSYRTGNINITPTNIGLGNVNNTSDADKPISTAQQAALDEKVDKVAGKGLSTNDYTTDEKNKLARVADEVFAYGVQWTKGQSLPTLTRVGNMSLHKSLPIQSSMRGCIAQGNNIIYWLNESDWRFKEEPDITYVDLTVSGTTHTIVDSRFSDLCYEGAYLKIYNEINNEIHNVVCKIASINTNTHTATLETTNELTNLRLTSGVTVVEFGSVLNGYDGTVRVYCPGFYIKSVINGDTYAVWISTVRIDNTYVYQKEILVDAYRSTILNTVPSNMGYLSTLPVNSAISVVNTHDYCRGGGNRSAYDAYLATEPCRSDLGKPITNMSRDTMRTYSRNAGSEMLSYLEYKNIFYWLYVIEYANFNCQATYNAELTSEGYRQGGLGNGVTVMDGNYWNYYNGKYPLTPCGYCNELGNGTGIKTMTVITPTNSSGSNTSEENFSVPRWRGFDNPFGDLYTNLDGVIIQGDAEGNLKNVYATSDPANYGDDEASKLKMEIVGHEIHQNGYIKEFDLGETAQIIPIMVKGDTTLGKCDFHWAGDKDTSLRTLLVGGYANSSSDAGLCNFYSRYDVSYLQSSSGFRSVSSSVSGLS